MKVYDTLRKELVEFEPRDPPRVYMYVCGPTVYDSPHVGHARSAVAFDVIRRYLEYKGYDVVFARNYTDIDDKMIARAGRIKIDAITDWILQDQTIDNCQVFIGMRAAMCVGSPSNDLQTALQNMLFVKSIFNVSLNLFSLIWNLGKKLRVINKQVPDAGYKVLKAFNLEIGKLNNELSLLSVLDEMLQVSIQDKQETWDDSESKKNLPGNIFNIDKDFKDENAKTEDRRLILKELTTYLAGVRDNIEQRMDLILTKNSEYLNLIVLALTVITVISVADIFSFNLDQVAVVILAMIPFISASLLYLRNYLKNFK